jgi:hypothetical protein
MIVLKMFMIAITLTGCAHTFSGDELGTELEGIPEFESLVGIGTLEVIEPGYDTSHVQASLSINENYNVIGRNGCKALIINTDLETVLAVAQCPDSDADEYLICADEPNECEIYFETKHGGNSLTLIKDWGWGYDETRRRVEFYPNKVVYRIQSESCLIPYPHGCIIDGIGWVDLYTYNYNF